MLGYSQELRQWISDLPGTMLIPLLQRCLGQLRQVCGLCFSSSFSYMPCSTSNYPQPHCPQGISWMSDPPLTAFPCFCFPLPPMPCAPSPPCSYTCIAKAFQCLCQQPRAHLGSTIMMASSVEIRPSCTISVATWMHGGPPGTVNATAWLCECLAL